MVQRLFADVINDAIWFMNIHEQKNRMCIFFQYLPHISISMSLKSFSIYIVKFFELYISAVLLPIDNLKEGFTSFFYLSSRDSIGIHANISTIL
jgi:hypothetical protein